MLKVYVRKFQIRLDPHYFNKVYLSEDLSVNTDRSVIIGKYFLYENALNSKAYIHL